MVSRTAYAQFAIRRSCWPEPCSGWTITYLAPVLLAVFAGGMAQILGIAAWLLMALAFQPTCASIVFRRSGALALPAIAATYMAFTLDSAYQHARGRGGMWKGRAQANVQELTCGKRTCATATFRNCDERCEHERRRPIGGRERDTGTKIFRSPRFSFIRAIAG